MKRPIQIMFFVILMILTLTPGVFAQSDTDIVRFDGIYQSAVYAGQGKYIYSYYRFFPNKTVSKYSTYTEERPSDIYKALEIAPMESGKYVLNNDGEIKFTLSYVKGNVDYTGTIQEDKLHLVYHSNISNHDGRYDCSFIEVNR